MISVLKKEGKIYRFEPLIPSKKGVSMARNHFSRFTFITAVILVSLLLLGSSKVTAHCDTSDGPVIKIAKQALEKGDVTPVLKWVKKEDEEQIKAAFKKTMAVRAKGPEAKDLADNYFFETLVRIHRAGEGASFTGLKDEPVEPIVAMSDKAIETGNVDSLANKIAAHVKEGIKERFTKAVEAKKNSDKSVAAGREFVEAYVKYVHYIEGIHEAAMSKGEHHDEGAEGGKGGHEK
jgi:preprotein translocase subunit SecF